MIAELYGRSNPPCIYCTQAFQLLDDQRIPFIYHDVSDPTVATLLRQRVPGAKTVPQIFIDGQLVGGYDQLVQFLGVE